MYRLFILFTGLLMVTAGNAQELPAPNKAAPSLSNFKNSTDIMVVAHRGDWRNAPENSVWAIKLAMAKGVDMAEIDLAMTKDSVLILMHDKTIDRTTTGVGKPSDYTWDELQALRLRDGLGVATQMKIPRLHDILILTNGKILLNLDKGYEYIRLVYPMLKQYDMVDQVLFKGSAPYAKVREDLGALLDTIHYMPIIRLAQGEGAEEINAFTAHARPFGFEFTVGENEDHILDFAALRQQGYHVWVNSLWPQHNAGHQDDRALEDKQVYDWYLEKDINIIQTDRPELLIDFLRTKHRHQ